MYCKPKDFMECPYIYFYWFLLDNEIYQPYLNVQLRNKLLLQSYHWNPGAQCKSLMFAIFYDLGKKSVSKTSVQHTTNLAGTVRTW